jgi:hypothetical protein
VKGSFLWILRILAAVYLMLCFIAAVPGYSETTDHHSGGREIAYRYTDHPENDDESTEFLDGSGQPIRDYEYREKFRKQSEDLQKRAEAPFGQANKEFGREKPEVKPLSMVSHEASRGSSPEAVESPWEDSTKPVPEALPEEKLREKEGSEKSKVLVS